MKFLHLHAKQDETASVPARRRKVHVRHTYVRSGSHWHPPMSVGLCCRNPVSDVSHTEGLSEQCGSHEQMVVDLQLTRHVLWNFLEITKWPWCLYTNIHVDRAHVVLHYWLSASTALVLLDLLSQYFNGRQNIIYQYHLFIQIYNTIYLFYIIFYLENFMILLGFQNLKVYKKILTTKLFFI